MHAPIQSTDVRWTPLSLKHILRAVIMGALLVGCTGDAHEKDGEINNESDASVNADTSASTPWDGSIMSPEDGAVLDRNDLVMLEVTLTSTSSSGWAGFTASVTIDDESTPLASDLTFDNNGVLTNRFDAGPGAHTVHVKVTSPTGDTRTFSRDFAVNIAPGAGTLAWDTEQWPGLAPSAGEDLIIIATPPDDPTTKDGAPLTPSFVWRKVGATTNLPSTTDTLAKIHTKKGDRIEVLVTYHDGFEPGPPARAEVTIANAAPSCTAVTMRPSAIRNDQAVTCACAGFSDIDGDTDASECTFTDLSSGEVLGTPGDCVLPAGSATAGMKILCTVTPHDGTTAGTAIASGEANAVLVLNSTPSAPVATLSPTSGDALTEFTCGLTTAGVDPDGDSVTHAVSWTVAGEAVTSDATTTTGEALGAGKGEALCCRITASDGSASAQSQQSCTTLENAPPVTVNVFTRVRGGGSATRRSILDCEPENARDPDGDTITITYAWYVGSEPIASATSSSLSAASLPRGSIVSCQATICDATLCTEPIASKNALQITNSPPELGGVVIVPEGEDSHPGDTLTCTFSGWNDPDGDPVAVTYEWVLVVNGVETVLATETSADLEVELSMPAGAELICRVTPWNGEAPGPTVSSDPRVVGEAIPVAPMVAVVAPNGADGTLTCQTTQAAQFIPAAASWTWRWSRNGTLIDTPGTPSGTTLAADRVSHCDLVECWVEIRHGDLSLDSNKGSSLMPLGNDCNDGNPCTSATCFNGGGCNIVAADGGPCDDGDACTENEVCEGGACVGTLDVCIEDRLSDGVTPPSTMVGTQPWLAKTPNDGYLASWWASTPSRLALRLTNRDESRVLETHTAAGGFGRPGVTPSGRTAVFRLDGLGGLCPGVSAQYHIRIYGPEHTIETAVGNQSYSATHACISTHVITVPAAATLVGFGDEGFAMVLSRYSSTDLTLQLVDAAGNHTMAGTAVSGVATGDSYWDVALVPDGTDSFVIAWASTDRKSVYAQRFARNGSPELDAPVLVTTTTGLINTVRVDGMQNGRFVVAWQGTNVDSAGQGIAAQRFDESGTKLGSAIMVPAVETGDQLLGSVAALSTLQFVVTWNDASTPTRRVLARVFTSTGTGGEVITVNRTTNPGSNVPAITALTNDEWVVAWLDTSNVLWTRRYDRHGAFAPRAAEFRANDEANGPQQTPVAAGTVSGRVMVAYVSRVISAGTFGTEVMARVFDEDGLEVRPEHIVYGNALPYSQTTPTVAAGTNQFVVAWNSEEQDGDADGIFARVYDDEGLALAPAFGVTQTTAGYQRQPAVAMSHNGTWVAAWNGQTALAGSTSDIFARVFPAGGEPLDEFTINATTANVQERPAIAFVPFTTDFVVAWQSQNQEGSGGSGLGIFVRKFGADGVAKSPEFPANTFVAGNQREPTVAISQTGNTFVCWESVGQVTANKPVIACQRFRTSDLLPQGAEFLPMSWADSQSHPEIAILSNGRLAITYQALGLDSDAHAIQVVQVNDLGVSVTPRLTANRTWLSEQTRPWIVPQDDRYLVGWQSALQDGSEDGIYFRILPLP